MAEPTSKLTFTDLIQRVARKAGIAYYGSASNEKAMVPVDTFNLDLCKDIVNDAIRMFISDAPERGWRWTKRIMSVELSSVRITGTADAANGTSITDATLIDTYDTTDDLLNYYCYILTGTGTDSFAKITAYNGSSGKCTVADWLDQYGNAGGTDPGVGSTFAITSVETVGGDIARYPLAEDFGGESMGKIDYAANTTHATPIEWCNESWIRARRAVTVTTSYPFKAAICPLEPAISSLESGSAKRRFELLLWPQPVAADTLEFPYNLTFDSLQLETGTATNGAATAISDSSLANLYPDDYFLGWRITVISGTGKRATAIVTSYVGADGEWFVADWLYPDGTAAVTNPASGSIYTVEPVNNVHPAGLRFDESILAACMARLEMDSDELQEDLEQRYVQKAIPLAHRIDARSAPRTLGSMNRRGGPYDHRDFRRLERTWNTVVTDHDV